MVKIFRKYTGLSLLAWVVTTHSGVVAAADPEQDLFSLPLQELLNISVVSKQSEAIRNSPGIVSRYEAEDLKAMGLNTLKDFLHFVPGVEINAQINRLSVAQIRGLPANSNQKILFMLNGVPYWMPETGDFPLQGIPLEAIQRIEVIRGPGSVVYGTNASAGVINVLLRDDRQANVRAYVRDEGLRNGSLYLAGRSVSGWWADVSGEIQRDDGYDYAVRNAFEADPGFTFPETASGELERKEEHGAFVARLGNERLTLMAQTFLATESGDINGSTISPTDYDSSGSLLSFNYTYPLESGELEIFSDWNRYHRDADAKNNFAFFGVDSDGGTFFENNGDNNKRFRNGAQLNYRLSDSMSVLMGAEYEERSIEAKKFRDSDNGASLTRVTQPPFNLPFQLQPDGTLLLAEASNMYEGSVFAQLDMQWERWRFVGGLRHVDNNLVGDDVSPRGAVVYSLNDNESFKLLYSEGFNSPTLGQLSATSRRGVPVNNTVSAETIRTYDFAYTRTTDHFHHVINVFHVDAQDLIRGSDNSSESVRRNGLEYEMQYLGHDFNGFAGASYIHEGNGHGDDEDADYTSRWLLKLGGYYSYNAHQVGASLRSAGPREGVDGYHWLNLNYRYVVNDHFQLFSSVTNVLNDDVEHPDVANRDRIVLEASDGIGALVGFVYRPGH